MGAGDEATGDRAPGAKPRPWIRASAASEQSNLTKSPAMAGIDFNDKCHSKGNQLEFWAAVHQLPIYEAAIDLCRALGRDVPWIERW